MAWNTVPTAGRPHGRSSEGSHGAQVAAVACQAYQVCVSCISEVSMCIRPLICSHTAIGLPERGSDDRRHKLSKVWLYSISMQLQVLMIRIGRFAVRKHARYLLENDTTLFSRHTSGMVAVSM